MYLGMKVRGRSWVRSPRRRSGEIDVDGAWTPVDQQASRDASVTGLSILTADPPSGNGSAETVGTSSGELPRIALQQRQYRNIWAQLRRDVTRIGVLLFSDVLLFAALRMLAGAVRLGCSRTAIVPLGLSPRRALSRRLAAVIGNRGVLRAG
jgi:hypothetical protein